MQLSVHSREIFHIALPAIVSNVTIPLLGMVDVAIVGHMGTSYIGAIAVGGLVLNVVYWVFGFLRAGTSGLTAQALGENNSEKIKAYFMRSVLFAVAISLFMLLFHIPLGKLAFLLIGASSQVDSLAVTYFRVCIYGAPAVMMTTALTGWFIGMQNTRIPMVVAIVQNMVNIPVSLFLVYCLGLKIEGVALGTVVAQYVGLFLALIMRYKLYRSYCGLPHGVSVIEWKEMRRFANVNKDIFLRTVCLIAVTVFFTSASARQGELVLAANTLLLQLFYFFSYVMDGFANSGEAISGRLYGAGQNAELAQWSKTLFGWGMIVMVCFTLVYLIGGIPFLGLLTNDDQVLNIASSYYIWAVFVPFAGFAAFLWDGIFIGLTMTAEMLLSAVCATIIFFAGWYFLGDIWHNHALWFSFLLYLFFRGFTQTFLFIKKRKNILME